MTDEKDHIAVAVVADTIVGKCHACGERIHQPNKGLGRANLAAWKSRHQHAIPPVKEGANDRP